MAAMTFRTLIVPGLVAAVFASACDDPPPPPAAVAQPAAVAPANALPNPVAAAEAAADAGTTEVAAYVYAYDPVSKRDPFRSPMIEQTGPGSSEKVACEGPLASWDLAQLKLVATVTSDANPLGMVEDPQGKGHVVRRNSIMGRLCGKVTEVLRDCITVTEYYPAPDGKRVPNPKKMCLVADVGGEGVEDLQTGKKF